MYSDSVFCIGTVRARERKDAVSDAHAEHGLCHGKISRCGPGTPPRTRPLAQGPDFERQPMDACEARIMNTRSPRANTEQAKCEKAPIRFAHCNTFLTRQVKF